MPERPSRTSEQKSQPEVVETIFEGNAADWAKHVIQIITTSGEFVQETDFDIPGDWISEANEHTNIFMKRVPGNDGASDEYVVWQVTDRAVYNFHPKSGHKGTVIGFRMVSSTEIARQVEEKVDEALIYTLGLTVSRAFNSSKYPYYWHSELQGREYRDLEQVMKEFRENHGDKTGREVYGQATLYWSPSKGLFPK